MPDAEFVELFNKTEYTIDLSGWSFSDSVSDVNLPESEIEAAEYIILCQEDAKAAYSKFGKTLGLTSWPSLNNSGDILSLKDQFGKIVFSIEYSSSWYKDNLKTAGGWSLEMIDTDYSCLGEMNWRASVNSAGGTPGEVNSVQDLNPDQTSPELERVFVLDSVTILLYFSETLDSVSATNLNAYSMDQGLGHPIKVVITHALFNQALLTLPIAMNPNLIYKVSVSAIF